MLLTPRAPSTAAEGGWWLRERFEELVEAVVAGRRLRHFTGWDEQRRGLRDARAGFEQRGQGKSLSLRDPLVAGRVEAAVRVPDVGVGAGYVVDKDPPPPPPRRG